MQQAPSVDLVPPSSGWNHSAIRKQATGPGPGAKHGVDTHWLIPAQLHVPDS